MKEGTQKGGGMALCIPSGKWPVRRWVRIFLTGALALFGFACSSGERPGGAGQAATGGKEPVAVATIEGASGSKISGQATFTQTDGAVKVEVSVKGFPPGLHGIHVHEKGECHPPDFMSSGGHFNPDNMPHGGPETPMHHAGDLGNIEVGADGTGKLVLTTKDLTVGEGTHSVVGRSIMIHEKEDDLKSQPAGNSGARIGCGVIKLKA